MQFHHYCFEIGECPILGPWRRKLKNYGLIVAEYSMLQSFSGGSELDNFNIDWNFTKLCWVWIIMY